ARLRQARQGRLPGGLRARREGDVSEAAGDQGDGAESRRHARRTVSAGALRGRDDRGRKALQRRRAARGGLRQEGLPAAPGAARARAAARVRHRDRRRRNRARARRPGDVVAQRLPHAGRAREGAEASSGAACHLRACHRGLASAPAPRRARDREPHHGGLERRLRRDPPPLRPRGAESARSQPRGARRRVARQDAPHRQPRDRCAVGSTEMWNLSFAPPQVIQARVLTRLPEAFRKPRRNDWADANKPGEEIASFLEGPTFDREGRLYVCDIPYGRIFRISADLEWTLVAQYDGWPNGTALHRDGSLWIADYRRGLLKLDVSSGGDPIPILPHRNSESFRGVNDLT